MCPEAPRARPRARSDLNGARLKQCSDLNGARLKQRSDLNGARLKQCNNLNRVGRSACPRVSIGAICEQVHPRGDDLQERLLPRAEGLHEQVGLADLSST